MYRRESGVSPTFVPNGGVDAREDAVHLSLSLPPDSTELASSSSLSNAYATPTKLPRREPELRLCGRSLRLARLLECISYAVLVPSVRIDAVRIDVVSASTSETERGVRTIRSFTPAPESRDAPRSLSFSSRARTRRLERSRSFLRRASLSRSVWILRITSGSTAGLWCVGSGSGSASLPLRSARRFLLCSSFGVACPLPGCPRNVGCFCNSTPWSSSSFAAASLTVSSSPELQDVPAAGAPRLCLPDGFILVESRLQVEGRTSGRHLRGAENAEVWFASDVPAGVSAKTSASRFPQREPQSGPPGEGARLDVRNKKCTDVVKDR